MGLAASQSRLLSLTARLSDLELQAQSISNSKIRLADASADASQAYEVALSKEKLTVVSGYDKNGVTYSDATAHNLTTYNALYSTDKQRFLKDSYGRVILNENVSKSFGDSHGDLEAFLNGLGYTSNSENTDTTLKNDSGATSYYTNVFNEINENGSTSITDDESSNSDWLYQQLNSGNLTLSEYNSDDEDFEDVSWKSGDTTLKTSTDDTQTAKAEASYDSTMAQIQSKDKRFDLQLQNINTEHTAVQTEIDSVKKVIDKNIDRSFKIFNA